MPCPRRRNHPDGAEFDQCCRRDREHDQSISPANYPLRSRLQAPASRIPPDRAVRRCRVPARRAGSIAHRTAGRPHRSGDGHISGPPRDTHSGSARAPSASGTDTIHHAHQHALDPVSPDFGVGEFSRRFVIDHQVRLGQPALSALTVSERLFGDRGQRRESRNGFSDTAFDSVREVLFCADAIVVRGSTRRIRQASGRGGCGHRRRYPRAARVAAGSPGFSMA